MTTITLNNGLSMPRLGLGVWQVSGDTETERVVRMALEAGYRSVDTAKIYGNERGVGNAIRAGGVPREQLFITTKLWNDDIRRGKVAEAFEQSLKLLGLDYVDLYLVHWAIPGKITSTWRAMEKLHVETPLDPDAPDVRRRRDILAKYHQRMKEEATYAYKPLTPVVPSVEDARIARGDARLWPIVTVKG